MTASGELARAILAIDWDGLGEPTRRRVLDLVLDLLGVLVRGSGEPSSRPVRELAAARPLAGGASAAGVPSTVDPAAAALANGTAAHAIELDDVTRASSLHPGVAVIPAALATAEVTGASGRAFLEAVVAGYEVTLRVGNALDPASAYARGFHPTGVAGGVGAAVAAGRLRGLDEDGLVRAIGIAATMAAGSLEYLADGAWTKRLNAGWAAAAGVTAAELAERGFTGPATAIEGRLGLLHAYSDRGNPSLLADGLGRGAWLIDTVAIKPYACCRYNHGLIDGMLELRERHGLVPADVTRIRLGVLSGGALLVAEPIEAKRAPSNVVDAQFSAPFAAAVALVRGAAGVAEYVQATVDDPAIRALMARTDCVRSEALDAVYPERWPAEVRVETTDGRVLEAHVPYATGEPERPVAPDLLLAKFHGLAAAGLEAAARDRLAADVAGLPDARRVTLGASLREVAVGSGHP